MLNNFAKFKIGQHPRFVGTELDVALYLQLFPVDRSTGKTPSVFRDAIAINGVGVGYDPTSRRKTLPYAAVHVA